MSKQEQLEAFYRSKFGRVLYAMESQEVAKVLSDSFGYYLLQLGGVQNHTWLNSSPIAHQYWCHGETTHSSTPNFHSDFHELPIKPNSIDLLFMPHTLEFTKEPQEVIQEASLALIPEGVMIILGFNPLSLFGLKKLITGNLLKKYPLSHRFIRMGKIRKWLENANCEIDDLRSFFYMPPQEDPKEAKASQLIEILAKSGWSLSGGCYIIVARKRMTTMTPIKEKWRLSRLFAHKGKIPQPSLWRKKCSKR